MNRRNKMVALASSSIGCLLLGFLFLQSCVYTPTVRKGNQRVETSFLEAWQDDFIVPAFDDYYKKTEILWQAAQIFEQSQTDSRQEAFFNLKKAFEEAYISFQRTIIFDRKLSQLNYKNLSSLSANIPANVSQIKANVNSHFTKETLEQEVADGIVVENSIGFPALDYLLFNRPFSSISPEERSFISVVSAKLTSDAQKALTYYTENRDEFLTNNDFSVSGSLSVLVNTLISNYEKDIRTTKVGVPIGIYGVINHSPAPTAAEAYYHGEKLSNTLLLEAMKSFLRFYYGVNQMNTDFKPSDVGFRAFLVKHLSSQPGLTRPKIVERTDQHLHAAIAKMQALNQDIAVLVSDSDGRKKLQDTYDDMQKIVGILKTDVITALGLSVTYVDGEEGD